MSTTTQNISIDWQDAKRGGKVATLKVDGFDIALRLDMDYEHDFTDSRGKFTDKWEQGALKNPNHKWQGNHVYKYFVPEYTVACHLSDCMKSGGYTIQEARQEAVRCAKQDRDICADPDSAGISAVYVKVTVSFKGVELASDASYGIEVESLYAPDGDCIDEIAREKINDALAEARQKLSELRA